MSSLPWGLNLVCSSHNFQSLSPNLTAAVSPSNPSLGKRLRQEDRHRSEANLGCRVRLCLNQQTSKGCGYTSVGKMLVYA